MAKKKRSSRKVAGKRLTKKVKGKPSKPGKAGGKKGASKKHAAGHPPAPGPLGTPKDRAIAMLRFSRGMLEKALADWPEEKYTAQMAGGTPGCENHALWIVGHLAAAMTMFFGPYAGIELPPAPEGWNDLFSGNKDFRPTGDASRYPSMNEAKAWFEKTFDLYIEGVEAQSEEELATDIREKTGGFSTDRMQLIEQAAWHVGWHFGQLTSLRRSLGLKPIM